MRNSGRRGPARPARRAVSATFLVMGLTGGVWNARIPAAKSQVHLSDGTLGLALLAIPVGLVLGAALAERLVDRIGSAVLVRICGLGACAAAVTPGLARTLPELMAGLFVIGVFGGTLDVSANAQGLRVEAAYGRPVMTSMHAFFSLGAILGSLAGGGFAALGVTLLPSLVAVAALGAVIDGTAGFWLLADVGQRRTGPPAAVVPGAPVPDAPTAGRGPASPGRRQVRRLVLALGVLGICGLVGEGAAGDWSAVYLRDNLGTSAAVASLGFAAFSVTMTLGRGCGDWLIQRYGVVAVVRTCGAVATAGLALALVTSIPAVAITGFTAFGAGLSIVVPQVFAAGGRADPERPGSGLARVVGLGYTGMAAGPAVIGLVADRTGLHLALLIPLVLAAWIAVGARVLCAPGRRWHTLSTMDDKEIMGRISDLIGSEHELRRQLAAGELSSEQERERLRSTEEALDQCWDLLRQRRAKRQYGESPDGAEARPVPEVEGYQQLCPGGPPAYKESSRDRGDSPSAGILSRGHGGPPPTTNAKEHRAYREVRQGRRGCLRRR